MQRVVGGIIGRHGGRDPRKVGRLSLGWLVGVVLAGGCGGEGPPPTTGPARPYAGVTLTVRCPDAALAKALRPAVNSWATRTGAEVVLRTDAMTPGDDSDLGIITPVELGAWAERGELTPVPAALRAVDHPFQWSAVLPPYREHLIEWGGQAQAVPLTGDGFVTVYRADRLNDPKFVEAYRAQAGQPPAEPTTWEDFAVWAAALTALDGRPALPPLTASELTELFFRVAACYDRPAWNESTVAGQVDTTAALSFQYALATGSPRLTTAGFQKAAQWLGGLAAAGCLPPPADHSDPTAALAEGRASLAVVSLAHLERLPRENGRVAARFAVAPLPGARAYVDPKTRQLVPATGVNYIPYFGGGRLGVVRSRCPRPDAAFDLLADLGGPVRSQELIATPGLGAGPFRTTHLEQDRLLIWLQYDFDPGRSTALLAALRQYVRVEVKNPTFALRLPHQAELAAAAATEVAAIASRRIAPSDGLARWQQAWEAIDARLPLESRTRWLRLAAGIQ